MLEKRTIEKYTSDDDIFYAVYLESQSDEQMVMLANQSMQELRATVCGVYKSEHVNEATKRLYSYLQTYKRIVVEQWTRSTDRILAEIYT